MIRILIFLNTSAYGGVEEVVVRLAQRLDRSRFEVHIAAAPALLEAFRPCLEGRPTGFLALELDAWTKFREIRRFIGYLRRHRIQVLNTHMFRSSLFAAPIARLAGVPVVIETGHGPEAWRARWTFFVDGCIERFVTANIPVSEACRDFQVRVKHYPPEKLHVVHNGRDLARYAPVPEAELRELRGRHALPAEARIVVCIARLEEQKGHRYLMEALPAVVRKYPEVRVLVVGEGSLRAALERQAAENGLQRNVIFAGFARRTEPYYQAGEFVVLPSLYEGLPLVAIEAGASSRAIVASAVDGTCEVVVDGETGLLVPPAAPEALAEAMLALLDDANRARRMGQAARRRMEEEFSLERQVLETARVYEETFARVTGGASSGM